MTEFEKAFWRMLLKNVPRGTLVAFVDYLCVPEADLGDHEKEMIEIIKKVVQNG